MKCKVCNKEFELKVCNHYIARDNEIIRTGIVGIVGTNTDEEPTMYDTFDCPHCGCQNVIQERKRAIKEDSDPSCLGDYDEEECSGCCEDEERCKEVTIDNNDEVSNNDSTPSCLGNYDGHSEECHQCLASGRVSVCI